MADKQDIPTWTKVMTGVVAFGLLIWTTAWAASKGDSAQANLVSSHETRLTGVESDMKNFDKRMDGMEKMYIRQEAGQKSLISGQAEMKAFQAKQNDLMIKRIENDAEIKAWIISIDKVNK